jgi:putative membrane protein
MISGKCSVLRHSIAGLVLVFGTTAAYAQATSESPRDSGIRKDAPSMQSASGASKAAGSVAKSDLKIMQQMAHSNLAEIETGKIAQSKSQNDTVKKFAQQMIDDHTKSQTELQQLAQAKGVTLPSAPDKKHQEMAKKLSGMSGEEFDRTYMKQGGVADHQKTLKLLQKAQKDAKDPELKALAAKTTPVVEQHLQLAQEHAGHGKDGGKAGSK